MAKGLPTGMPRVLLHAAGLAVLLCTALYLELRHEKTPPANKCELVERDDPNDSAETYGKAVASGYRNVRSRRVTVIPLRENIDPGRILHNVCEQRWYLSRLVPQLIAAGATAIVFDKTFGADSCDKDDRGTVDLISAVQHSAVPIVVGTDTHVPQADPNNACLIASPSLAFGNKLDADGKSTGEPAVESGLIRLNSDTRKIPLNWYSYSSDASFAAGEEPTNTRFPTLSWEAATLIDEELPKEPGLVQLRAKGQHPFSSFINPQNLSRADAMSVLCHSPARDEVGERYHVNCALVPSPQAELRGRLIVIGEDVPGRDRHQLLGNEVSGVYLQANYIESLLDGRYLRPFGTGWGLAALGVWLVFLYLIFWVQPEVALGVSLLVGILIKVFTIQLVMWKGLYPQVWLPELGAAAMVLKYIEARGHLTMKALEERRVRLASPSAAAAGAPAAPGQPKERQAS